MEVAFSGQEYWAAVELRRRVLRYPLGLDFSAAELAAEEDQVHFAIFSNGVCVACASVVRVDSVDAKVRQVAVDPESQGKGFGRAIMGECEQWARSQGFQRVVLHARETAIEFYLRLNYTIVGDAFTEVGIPHKRMVRAL